MQSIKIQSKLRYGIFIFFLVFSPSLFAQQTFVVAGVVMDQAGKGIEQVNIKIEETNQYYVSGKQGAFKLALNTTEHRDVTIIFSYIGYQKVSRKLAVDGNSINLGRIILKTLDLSLDEININAKRNYEGSSNSSLLIDRDMIEQIPALSINDLLNQIPNRKITPPSLQNVQNLTLRSTFEGVIPAARDPFALNNAFGVSIVMDGIAISNNANMQSYNPGMRGLSNTLVRSGNSYGLSGTGTQTYSGDYPFGGTDLRQIPVDNIESIEVIAGVPSAKYGDLTDGAVIIERQAGKSPAYLSMQLRDNATSYGFSKGFIASEKLGAINIGLNYVNSYADNRDKLKAYRRINTSAMWSNTFGKVKQLKNTFSIDYGQNLDGIRQDPDDPNKTKVRFDSWNFSVGNRSNYRIDGDFLKNIAVNLRYSEGHQETYKEELVNNAYVMYTDATKTGIWEGMYDTGIYNAISIIDGRPINLSTRLDLNAELSTGKVIHNLSFGAGFNYSFNKGLGQISDPNRPRGLVRSNPTSTSPESAERYYDFSLAIPQQDLGLYLEDVFKVKIADKDFNVRSGLRLDFQNGFASLAPRVNVNYALNENIRLGMAYGLGLKAPGLAHRYPGPTFIEVPLLNAYNGKAAESIYLVYVERYDPTNKNLKPSQNQTMEFTSHFKFHKFNLSVSAFNKVARNGISTTLNKTVTALPTYTATIRPGDRPLVVETGNRKLFIDYYSFTNPLRSNSQGVELILNTPQISTLSTSFNVSGGIFRTSYHTTGVMYGQAPSEIANTAPEYGRIGVYPPRNRTSYLSSGRITSTTHIPKISLIASFTAEFGLMQKTIYRANVGMPLAYYNNALEYITIPEFVPNDPLYGHLFIPTQELNAGNVPKVIANYHLSIGKEIKKRFRFSFNVFNVFNHQPSYSTQPGNLTYPNPMPTFGAQLSLKL